MGPLIWVLPPMLGTERMSGLDNHGNLPPGRSGMGSKLAMIGCRKMLSMKMEEIAGLIVA
jgi:hypothetical protein